jgi:REP element-mobilizing transposase RayT
MVLNKCGKVVQEELDRSAKIRREIELDTFVVMPNHIHGIVVIVESNVGATGRSPLPKGPTPKSVGAMMAGFKSAVTRRINDLRGTPYSPAWQRNYYEHVIRNEDDSDEIREYIVNNPLKWDLDRENPNNSGRKALRPYGNESRLCF